MSDLHADLLRLATEAEALVPFRRAVLERLAREVPFDAALFHAFSPRVPMDSAALFGLDPAVIAASARSWDALSVELGALRELANQHGVATDRQAFPAESKGRERFVRLVVRPFRMQSMAMVHLVVRGRVESAIGLFGKKEDAFQDAHVALLREIAPIVALGDALLVRETDAPRATVPVRLACADGRLTPRQRVIVEHVALGHTNDQIASALALSPNTLRNHLAEIFRRLGASNRADLVRLAVLTPRP